MGTLRIELFPSSPIIEGKRNSFPWTDSVAKFLVSELESFRQWQKQDWPLCPLHRVCAGRSVISGTKSLLSDSPICEIKLKWKEGNRERSGHIIPTLPETEILGRDSWPQPSGFSFVCFASVSPCFVLLWFNSPSMWSSGCVQLCSLPT